MTAATGPPSSSPPPTSGARRRTPTSSRSSIDAATGRPAVPNGSLGHRFGESGAGHWNLDLGEITPSLTLLDNGDDPVLVELPRFDQAGQTTRRGVPTMRVGDRLVTTVFDLMLAQYGVARDGLPGDYATSYDDAAAPYTPAWQESITGVPAAAVARIAREFAQNAADSRGRSMIIIGAGANHWFHSDTIYRAMLMLTTITGCQGVNGGGWAHYVGQEKARPITGWAQLAFGLDWVRPPRQMIQTAYWYLHTDQFRYDNYGVEHLTGPTATGQLAGMGTADALAMSARLGWMPSYPTFNKNPLDIVDAAEEAGQEPAAYVVDQLQHGDLRFACEDPDAPENFPRVLTMWRANLFGSSGKGNEYFLKHLLGTDSSLQAHETPPGQRPRDLVWRDEAPEGKLDLLCTLDFRMTSSTMLLRHRAPGRHVVREARHLHDRHAPLHPLVQPGDQPPVADPDGLGDLQDAGGGLLAARRQASGGAQGSGGGSPAA